MEPIHLPSGSFPHLLMNMQEETLGTLHPGGCGARGVFFFFFSLNLALSLKDLSSPTRDRTQAISSDGNFQARSFDSSFAFSQPLLLIFKLDIAATELPSEFWVTAPIIRQASAQAPSTWHMQDVLELRFYFY